MLRAKVLAMTKEQLMALDKRVKEMMDRFGWSYIETMAFFCRYWPKYDKLREEYGLPHPEEQRVISFKEFREERYGSS